MISASSISFKIQRLQSGVLDSWLQNFAFSMRSTRHGASCRLQSVLLLPKETDPPAKVADEVLSILHVHDKPVARIELLHVVRRMLTASQFAAICSALPHAHVLHTLDLHESFHPMIERVHLSDEDMVWLGYALFHPDTVTSSWKILNVENAISKCKSAPFILQRMVCGNYLTSILSGSFDQVCSAYYSAQFSNRTKVQVGSTVVVIDSNSRYDLCLSSDDLTKLPHTVSIVVPGLGLGTVEKSRIKTISAR